MNYRQSFIYIFFSILFVFPSAFARADDTLQLQLQQEIDVLKASWPENFALESLDFDSLVDEPFSPFNRRIATTLLFVASEMCGHDLAKLQEHFPGLCSLCRPKYIADLDRDSALEILCVPPSFIDDDFTEILVVMRQSNKVKVVRESIEYAGLVELRHSRDGTAEIVVYEWDSKMVGIPEMHDVWQVDYLVEGVYEFTGERIQEISPVHIVHEEIWPERNVRQQFVQRVFQEIQTLQSVSSSSMPQEIDFETVYDVLYNSRQADTSWNWLYDSAVLLQEASSMCQHDLPTLRHTFPAFSRLYHPVFIGDLTEDTIPEIVLDLSQTRSRTTTLVVLQSVSDGVKWHEREIACQDGSISVEKSSRKIVVTCVVSQRKVPLLWQEESVVIDRTEEMELRFTGEQIQEIQPFHPSYEVMRKTHQRAPE